MSRSPPFELQNEIMNHVYRQSQSHTVDYKTLAACSLVCKDWRDIAQPLLFRRAPRIRTDREHRRVSVPSLTLLLRTLRYNPSLGGAVRSLFIDVGIFELAGVPQTMAAIGITLLGLCPGVVQIAFLHDIAEAGWNTPESADKLRALGICPTVLDVMEAGNSVDLYALLDVWPSVRFVQFAGDLVRPPADRPPQLFVQACGIQILGLREIRSWLDPSEAQISTIRSMTSSLRELDTGIAYFFPFGGDVGRVIAANIRSFTCLTIPLKSRVELLTALEEIIVTMLPNVARTIPPSVWHVGYHLSPFFEEVGSPNALISMLSALPNLQLVTATRQSSSLTLRALEDACRLSRLSSLCFLIGIHFRGPDMLTGYECEE